MDQRECARLEAQDGERVMLNGITVTGDLRGLMFEARVEQRFRNPTSKNVQVVYTFPLPWGAVLMGVDVQLGGKHLTGVVVGKEQAEARYEEALSGGNAAIMLERNHDHSYSLNLGNLAAQEDCVITLRYAQTLQFEQRGLRLLLPTVIAPRFGDVAADGGLQPHQARSYSLLAEYPFDIELRLHGELAHAHVASPSHPVRVTHGEGETGTELTVSLALCGSLDRDFVLVIDQLTHASVAVMARDCVVPDGVVALASFCPCVPTDGPAAVAAKILVDCSGSMGGDSIDAARRALQAIVRQLSRGDRFSLSRFGSTVRHRSRRLWTVTKTTQLAAQRWVGGLQADLGGTEMEAALSSTFALAQTVPSDLLLVTDGEISAIDSAIESAKSSGHRLFVVGIGSSPAESHLRRLADATGGACDFVAPGESVEPAVLRMFARLRSPRLIDLRLAWPADTKPGWVSPLPASVFDGDTVNVFALLHHVPVGEIHLVGRRGGESEEIGCVQFSAVVESIDSLSRVAASLRLESPVADRLVGTALEAKQLAVAYQLVTDQTSFLLVHARAEADKPADMPDLHKVRQMVPAGWGGTGSVLRSRSMNFFETRVTEYQAEGKLDWSELDAPAALRTEQESSVKFCLTDDADRPAFRRQRDHTIDASNNQYWSESGDCTGLTPLGLSEWLRITTTSAWPKSYLELRQTGLGTWVVDWLKLAMATREGVTLPEQTVVEAFLYLMSQRDTHESLAKALGLRKSFDVTSQRLSSLFTRESRADRPSVDAELVAEMMDVLDCMTADAWPDRLYSLGTTPGGRRRGCERTSCRLSWAAP